MRRSGRLAAICLAYGLYRVAYVPDDYQQGAMVKIMFVHVPAAWMALFGYSFIFLSPRSPPWCFAIRSAMSQPARRRRLGRCLP